MCLLHTLVLLLGCSHYLLPGSFPLLLGLCGKLLQLLGFID